MLSRLPSLLRTAQRTSRGGPRLAPWTRLAGTVPAKDASEDGPAFSASCVTDAAAPAIEGGSEGKLWIDGFIPLCTGFFDPRRLLGMKSKSTQLQNLRETLAAMSFKHPFVIMDVQPSQKEGGMLLTFNYQGEAIEAAQGIVEFLEKTRQRKWYSPAHPIRAFPVLGEPWVDDMDAVYATKRLKVDFEGPTLPEVNMLYRLFRPFGKIYQIWAPGSGGPRTATVLFRDNKRDGASAKNTLQGVKLPDGTKLNVTYVGHASTIKRALDFLNGHGRLAAILFGVLIALISWLVFDPLRRWFVSNKLLGRYGMGDVKSKLQRLGLLNLHVNELYEAASKSLSAVLGLRLPQVTRDLRALVSSETNEEIAKVVALMHHHPEAVAIVVGPKGSGKTQLINAIAPEFNATLVIDVEELLSQAEDENVLSVLASQTGYKPRFRGLNTIGALADSGLFALTGTKAGLATTTEQQFRDMLNIVTQALTKVVRAQGAELGARSSSFSFAEDSGRDSSGIEYPVIFIREIYARTSTKHAFVNDVLAEWAAGLVDVGVANVLMSSRNAAAPKLVSKFTSRNPEVIVLHDAPFERAKSFMVNALGEENVATAGPEVSKVLQTLGGRLEDLNNFIGLVKAHPRVRSGQGLTPAVIGEALESMIERSALDIRKSGFGIGAEDQKLPWTPEQLYSIIKKFTENPDSKIGVDAVRFNVFGGDSKPIVSLEHEELISIVGPFMQPGRPLLNAAFQRLVSDTSFAAGLEISSMQSEAKTLASNLEGWERELSSLQTILFGESGNGGVSKVTREARNELEGRIDFLLKKCGSASRRIVELEQLMKKAGRELELH